jgi:hypothetical protein
MQHPQMMMILRVLVDVQQTLIYLSSSRIGSHTLSGSISTPLGRTRNCLWQLLVETLTSNENLQAGVRL